MKLSEKIEGLRRSRGMSQEELAEKLNVSRQAVSRWEMGSALPDTTNVLKLSKLFGVTTDYLLNDEYQSDDDLPRIKEVKEDGGRQILLFLILLEVMILWIQFMTTYILQNIFFGSLSYILFVSVIVGFEYGYQKKKSQTNEKTAFFRKRFYKISAWLGLYFPIRLLAIMGISLYPRPYSTLIFEGSVLSVYVGMAIFVSLSIEKNYLNHKRKDEI